MMWVFFAVSAAVLTALASIVEKKTLFHQHAMEFSVVLAIFNFIVSLLLLPKVNLNIPFELYLMIYMASILGATAFLFFAKALRHSEISETSSLLNFRPALVFLLAFFFLKESLKVYQIFGLFLLVVGAYILEIKHKNESLFSPFKKLAKSKYSHYIFLSVCFYAVTSILDKMILNFIDPSTYIFVAHFFIAINFSIFITVFQDGFTGIKHGIKTSWKWIALVAFMTTGYRLLQANAISLADISLVSPIKHTSTFFAVLIGGKMFHETNLKQKLIAVTIMISGVILLVM